jgi:hypothetical protein
MIFSKSNRQRILFKTPQKILKMRKTIFILVIATFIIVTTYVGCQSSAKKEETPQESVQDAKRDFEIMIKEVNTEAENALEWEILKSETTNKISKNEVRVAELKVKMEKSGKKLNVLYAKKIDLLEQKNTTMRTSIESYENNKSDWKSFKLEFIHDIDSLG